MSNPHRPGRSAALLIVLVWAIASGAIAVKLTVDVEPGQPPSPDAIPAESHLADETPAGTALERGADLADQVTKAARLSARSTSGSAVASIAHVPGCETRFLERNYSSRNGATIGLLVAHYTVSANVRGRGDVDAIWNYFNRSSTQASSTFIVSLDEGDCIYAVPVGMKPWTQRAFNPYSVSIEFIARGDEPRAYWLRSKGLKVGAHAFAYVARELGIPARPALTSGCLVVRSGITDHAHLGCGNSHHDIEPNGPLGALRTLVYRELHPRCAPAPMTVEAKLNAIARPRPPLVIDGHYGERTIRTLRRFQAAHELPVTGAVTPATAKALGLCR